MHMLCKVRSENGYGFLRPVLKTGVENGIFWSEIGSGFEMQMAHPPWDISLRQSCSQSELGCAHKKAGIN